MKDFSGSHHKTHVVVIDGHAGHASELVAALSPFFDATAFSEAPQALAALEERIPDVIVLDELVPPGGGFAFLNEIRRTAAFATIPIIGISQTPNSDFFHLLRDRGVTATFEKPVPFRKLVGTIHAEVGRKVEAGWETIEPVQQSALKKTVAAFNRISDLVSDGMPLPYGEVRESCEPLVVAVENNQYKDMLRGVRGHDNYSYVHSLRVATFLSLFGHQIGIKGSDLLMLATGGLVHDIGKMSIPFEVLNKPGKLEGEEWEVMKSHVARTLAYLDHSPGIPQAVVIVAAQHHEKLSGRGYPRGLAGKQLNDLARMATIVDIFGALTDRRVYKDPMPPEKALSLMAGMQEDLDQQFLALFREMLLDAATEAEAA